MEITEENANVDEIVNRYIDNYGENEFDTVNYEINLGYSRTLKDYKSMLNKLKPCGIPINYREMNIRAKGNWKHIYEIAFGMPSVIITTKRLADEKTKQIRFKEAN